VEKTDIRELIELDENLFGIDRIGTEKLIYFLHHATWFPKLTPQTNNCLLGAAIFNEIDIINAVNRPTLFFWAKSLGIFEKDLSLVSLDWMLVRPQFQRQGIGSFLLKKAISRFQSKNISYIVLHSHSRESKSFYESLGFYTIRTVPEYYKSGADSDLMVYFLL